MGRLHHWYYLKDKEGRPIINADLNLYLTDTFTEATIYDTVTTSASIDQSTWVTGTSGFFDFFIGDQYEILYVGYDPDQDFDLYWATSASRYSGDDPPSGVIDTIQLQPLLFTVDETTQGSIRNKTVSNFLAYKWDEHPDKTYSLLPHEIFPVDETDSQDITNNKVVTNDLMNRLTSFPIVSAGQLTITTSGALFTQQLIYPSAWAPSGDIYYTTNIDTGLAGRNRPYPIVQIYDIGTGDMLSPVKVQDIDDTNIKIVMASNVETLNITVLGEIKPRVS